MWWCGPCRKIFVPGNFKQTSGCCFFTRNLVCCHLQCPTAKVLGWLMPSDPCIPSQALEGTLQLGFRESTWPQCPVGKQASVAMHQQPPRRFMFTNLSEAWPGSAAKALPETLQLGFRELNGHKSCWTWPGSAPKPPRPSPEPRSPVEPDLALHQSLPEPSPEPCWTYQKALLRT